MAATDSTQDAREGEPTNQKDCRGLLTRQIDHNGKPGCFKAQDLSAEDLCSTVIQARQKLGTSERWTFEVLGIARSRGGLVCLNSLLGPDKWMTAFFMLPAGLPAAY